MAVGGAPAEYRAKAEVKERVAEMTAFLHTGQDGQPLHNRVMLLLASTKLPEIMNAAEKRAIVADLWKRQQADGGWTIASLGPFKANDKAPVQEGSNGYATALVTYALQQSEGASPKLGKALGWLRTHQDREGGYWAAESMNHQYPAGSMELKFMRDAATAYASMALLAAGK
jgi:hypothetical protein